MLFSGPLDFFWSTAVWRYPVPGTEVFIWALMVAGIGIIHLCSVTSVHMLLKQQNRSIEWWVSMSSYNPTSLTFSLSSFKPYHPCIPPHHFNFMWVLLSAPHFSHPSPHDLFPAFWSLQTFQVTYKTNFKTMVHTRETTHDISLSGAGLVHPVWCSPNSLYFPAVFITSFFFSRVEFYFLNAPHFHYQFISWWRSRLSPFPS